MNKNIELAAKYKDVVEWLTDEENEKKGVLLKIKTRIDSHWRHANSKLFEWDNPSVIADIVINDDLAEFRKAYSDGRKIQVILDNGIWDDLVNPLFDCKPEDYRIKPAWKWEDEISEKTPVICYGEYKPLKITNFDDTKSWPYRNDHDQVFKDIKPVMAKDLLPFQRKGTFTHKELDDLKWLFYDKLEDADVSGQDSVGSFLTWLELRENDNE